MKYEDVDPVARLESLRAFIFSYISMFFLTLIDYYQNGEFYGNTILLSGFRF
jgi:hypothetical protein